MALACLFGACTEPDTRQSCSPGDADCECLNYDTFDVCNPALEGYPCVCASDDQWSMWVEQRFGCLSNGAQLEPMCSPDECEGACVEGEVCYQARCIARDGCTWQTQNDPMRTCVCTTSSGASCLEGDADCMCQERAVRSWSGVHIADATQRADGLSGTKFYGIDLDAIVLNRVDGSVAYATITDNMFNPRSVEEMEGAPDASCDTFDPDAEQQTTFVTPEFGWVDAPYVLAVFLDANGGVYALEEGDTITVYEVDLGACGQPRLDAYDDGYTVGLIDANNSGTIVPISERLTGVQTVTVPNTAAP